MPGQFLRYKLPQGQVALRPAVHIVGGQATAVLPEHPGGGLHKPLNWLKVWIGMTADEVEGGMALPSTCGRGKALGEEVGVFKTFFGHTRSSVGQMLPVGFQAAKTGGAILPFHLAGVQMNGPLGPCRAPVVTPILSYRTPPLVIAKRGALYIKAPLMTLRLRN